LVKFSGIPKGEPVTLIAYSRLNNKLQFASKKLNIGSNQTEKPVLHEIREDDFKQLAQLMTD